MKALTLWRPWPWAMMHAGKPVENRPWPLPAKYVGAEIALHSGKTMDHDALVAMRRGGFGAAAKTVPATGHPLGVVGVVVFGTPYEVADHFGTVDPWIFGPWAWPVERIIALKDPVPCRGAQGIWTLPSDVEAAVRVQLL